MDLSSPTSTTNSLFTPVFGDNVQDLLNAGALNVNPTGTIVVNSIADVVDDPNSGVTTLRHAVNQANADDGEDLIVFDRSLFSNGQTISLNLGELDITHNLDIIAPRDELTGGNLVTVSGNNATRVFKIEAGAAVNFSGLIVADGLVKDGSVKDDNGGGIKNSGTLTLDSSIVHNNSAFANIKVSTGLGGGIYNSGSLTVSNSTISNNSALSGAGIDNNGTLMVSSSTISNNSVLFGGTGGAIRNRSSGSTVLLSNSTISNNSAAFGGGIYNGGGINNDSGNEIPSNSTVVVNNSTISGNSAEYGGGIYNSDAAILTVSNSTISNNTKKYYSGVRIYSGGGIYNSGALTTVSNSTISGNSAEYGGGIYNSGALTTVSNSTISGNSAEYGSGISNNGGHVVNSGSSALIGDSINNSFRATVEVNNSTITQNLAFNLGGGVYNNSGSVSVRNTIIAANLESASALAVNPDVSGTFSSNGYNLIGDSTGSKGFGATGDIVGTSDNPIDPRLAPLDNNGGSTQTIALLPDSPAIDAADPTVLDTDPTTDQRGLPRVSGGRADIGAFEVQV